MTATAGACDACLRRSDLIAALAPVLDVEWRRRAGLPGVLTLSDEVLVALDPTGAVGRRYLGFDPDAARRRAASACLSVLCRCSDGYPARLNELADPPAALHVMGDPAALGDPDGAAVVGARRGTPYGIEVARGLGRGLSVAGVPVVSGLALGVDAAAHEGALTAAGPTVGVLAGGADVPYPAMHRRLYERVAARGCVASELPPGFRAMRWCFVARNRIIAGLAAVTVVVGATTRSGSLTTADFAEQAGRQVAAVPGPVTSRLAEGTNGLLASGAALVRNAYDVLELLFGPGMLPEPGAVPESGAPHGPPARGGTPLSSGAHPTPLASSRAAWSGALPADAATPAGGAGIAASELSDGAWVPPSTRPSGASSPRFSVAARGGSGGGLTALEGPLRTLLDAVEQGRGSLAALTGEPERAPAILAGLTELERLGLVRRDLGGRYVRVL